MDLSDYPINALMEITNRPPLVFTTGAGMWLYDHSGKKYLDYLQGWAVNCLGHAPALIQEALQNQSKKLINPSPGFYNEPMIELAALLKEHSVFDRVFFANSGAEANEGAIKLARKWGKRYKNNAHEIITFDQSFHGRTLATMSASGKAGWDTMFAPQVSGFHKAVLNDIDSVKRLITDSTVAIMLEPVQGEGGVIPADKTFMQALRELTRAHDMLLIVDEVQTGMGRTGSLFAYQNFDIEPDIMTLGKGIGGGVPLSALLATENAACFERGDQGGTYNGNPLMTAVGVAIFKHISQPAFLKSVQEKGAHLSSGLNSIARQFHLPGERGMGLLRALMLGAEIGAHIVDGARGAQPVGLLVNSPRPSLLRFMPALNVTYEEIDQMLDILAGVFSTLQK